jgi:hypothetical protein
MDATAWLLRRAGTHRMMIGWLVLLPLVLFCQCQLAVVRGHDRARETRPKLTVRSVEHEGAYRRSSVRGLRIDAQKKGDIHLVPAPSTNTSIMSSTAHRKKHSKPLKHAGQIAVTSALLYLGYGQRQRENERQQHHA